MWSMWRLCLACSNGKNGCHAMRTQHSLISITDTFQYVLFLYLISTGRKHYPCFYNEKGDKKIFRKVKKKRKENLTKARILGCGLGFSFQQQTSQKNSHYISEERIKNYSTGIYNFKLPITLWEEITTNFLHAWKITKPHSVNRFICSLNKHSLSVNYVTGAICIRCEKDKLGVPLI